MDTKGLNIYKLVIHGFVSSIAKWDGSQAGLVKFVDSIAEFRLSIASWIFSEEIGCKNRL